MKCVLALLALLAIVAAGCSGCEEATLIPASSQSEEPAPPWPRDQVIAGRVLTREGEGFAGIQLVAWSELSKVGYCRTTSDESGAFRIDGLTEGPHTVLEYSAGHEFVPLEHVAASTTDLVLTLVESARVSGRVLDPSGPAIESFLVEVHAAEVEPRLGTVVALKTFHLSSDGAFELGGLPEGVLTVEATAEGFAPSFSEPFRTVRDSTTKDVVVRMNQGGSLAGVVLDASSRLPIAGAEVFPLERSWFSVGTGVGSERVRVPQWDVPAPLTRTVVRTDAIGRFAFGRMALGPHRLRIQARGYSSVVTDEACVEEQKVTELPPQSLIVGATITGIVLGIDGKIEPGANVQLAPIESGHSGDHRSAKADAGGRFTLENVSPSEYRLSATRASVSDDPFEAIVDIRRSEIEITVVDGYYELDLNLGPERR